MFETDPSKTRNPAKELISGQFLPPDWQFPEARRDIKVDPSLVGQQLFMAYCVSTGQIPLQSSGVEAHSTRLAPIIKSAFFPQSDEESQTTPTMKVLAGALSPGGAISLLVTFKDEESGAFVLPVPDFAERKISSVTLSSDNFNGLVISVSEAGIKSTEGEHGVKFGIVGLPVRAIEGLDADFTALGKGKLDGLLGVLINQAAGFKNFDLEGVSVSLAKRSLAGRACALLKNAKNEELYVELLHGPSLGMVVPVIVAKFPEDQPANTRHPVISRSVVADVIKLHQRNDYQLISEDAHQEILSLLNELALKFFKEKFGKSWSPDWNLSIEAMLESAEKDHAHLLVTIQNKDAEHIVFDPASGMTATSSSFSGMILHAENQIVPFYNRSALDKFKATLNVLVNHQFFAPPQEFAFDIEELYVADEIFEGQTKLLETNPKQSIFFSAVDRLLHSILPPSEVPAKIEKIRVSKFLNSENGPRSVAVLVKSDQGQALISINSFGSVGYMNPAEHATCQALFD